MCDTLYVGPEAGSSSFFGKNSDRHPSEPQALCIVPKRAASDDVKVGDRSFAVADKGFSYALSKPSWISGGEIGLNEKGVAIGNEAVFSRFKPAKEGVLGMDLLRAALAACATAHEALDFLCRWVETNDQGGNGAYRGSLYYNNSFLIADATEAFVLETAAHRWAWRQAAGRDAISNAYCITDDYKRLDAETRKAIAPVNERAACSDEADPGRKGKKESWREHVENRFYLHFTKGDKRRALALALLDSGSKAPFGAAGRPPVMSMFAALRSHGGYDPERPRSKHMESLCVHKGGLPQTATTASLVVEWRPDGTALLWFTGTSYPCLSLYKPVLLAGGEFIPICDSIDPAHSSEGCFVEGSRGAYKRWSAQRSWIRRHTKAFAGIALASDPAFASSRDLAQSELVLIAERAASEAAAGSDRRMLDVLRREAGAIVAGWEKDQGLRK